MALKENKNGHRFDKIYYFSILILLSSILLSNVAAAEVLHVSSSRYSIFAPDQNKASHTSLSANFTGYAILLNNTGRPVSGQSITFRIYSPAGLKATFTNITQQNGLASVSYDTYNDFNTSSDTDYGTWRIEANLTSNPSVNDRTNMRIEAGGNAVGGCGKDNCHETNTVTGAKPLSPYTANYGSTSTRAAAAHKKSNHQNAGCPACHPGYASNKTAIGTDGKIYGKTGDVHSNRTCEYCHGNWAYIRGTGNGIPKMPSCYQCHPVLNSNVMNISTLANLAAGNGISVFSYNYDLKKPLAAHNGTMYSLTDSVPCLVCHGPAHNNSKPYNAVSSSNSVTENEQCWTCHTNRATTHKSNTDCVSCHSQDVHKIISASGGPDCISCHDLTGTAPKKVDITVLQSSSHNNLNGASTGINKACYACHSDGTAPTSGHPPNYKNPKLCADCHTGSGNYSAPIVAEHSQNGTDIITTNATCNTCHDNSGMFLSNAGTNGMTTAFVHYIKDVTDTSTAPYQHLGPINTSNCIDCHNGAYTENASWGSPVNIATSTKRAHTETQTSQCDTCHKDSSIASLGLVDFHNASVQKASTSNCAQCHASYVSAVSNSMHNQTKNVGAPACTTCHINYDNAAGHNGYIVDNTTCNTCHINGMNGFDFGAMKTATCTQCHFANTTTPFDKNASLLTHDHNLTIEHSYNYYNQSGTIQMPLRRNGGTGLGMFPYWSCSQSCHGGTGANILSSFDNASITWVNSKHAQSLVEPPLDQKNSCAKCKSPLNYNATGNTSALIPVEDWQGIQCRVCHDIMNISYSNSTGGKPLAFYNATASSLSGYSVYDQVHNATELCEKCHSGSSHDSKFAGPHKDRVGFDCASCHLNTTSATKGGFNNRSHSFEVKNAYTGVTGCEVCHNPANHTFQFTSTHTGKVTCEACHDQTVSRNATGYAVTSDNKLGLYVDPATTEVSSWKGSAAAPSTWPLHNLSVNVSCDKCHGTKSAVTNLDLAPDIGGGKGCILCHKLSGSALTKVDTANFGVHNNVNNTDGGLNDSDCSTCHYNTSGMGVGYVAQPGINVYTCSECHTTPGKFGAPLVSEHNENGTDVITSATCTLCHSNSGMYLNNAGTNSTTTAVGHYIKDVTNTGTTPYQHNGSINTSNCIDCHNGAYTNNASWGSPVNISTSSKRIHIETQTIQCDLCHKDSNITSLGLVDFHNASLQGSDTNNCLGCHNTVTSSDLGLHSTLNGTSAVENGDCKTCHYGSFPMVKGAVNNSNTYFCADCHTPGSTNPKKSTSRIFTEKMHGKAACMDCHVADGVYHQGNPRGSVANLTYVNRFNTTNTVTTDCADCHSAANLDDAPFNAPGMGTHSVGACATGGCHGGGTTAIEVVHSTNPWDSLKPTITVPTLDSSTVTQGTDVNVTVTVNFATNYATIDGAQYRIMSGTTEFQSWTPMSAADGNFNTANEVATGRIKTNNLSGTYNIEVRGMAGGPSQNSSERYYPMNGDMSTTSTANLTVLPSISMGYLNVTITSGGMPAPEAKVWINSSDIKKTDANGNYIFTVPEDTYNVTASKQPTNVDKTVTGMVTPNNTTNVTIALDLKPTGTIIGTVRNV